MAKKTIKFLTDKYFAAYTSVLDMSIEDEFALIKQRKWTPESFRFYTAVSVISSSRIEGEEMEIDSYLKHKMQQIEYLPNLTEKPNDLFEAYEFARDKKLTLENFFEVHSIATRHLLPENQRGIVRSGNMLIMEQQTQNVQHEAAQSTIVEKEFSR